MRLLPAPRRRRGSYATLTAFKLIFLAAATSMSVDMGYILVVKHQLQNAADAAALAGSTQLLDKSLLKGHVDKDQLMANARAEAQRVSCANKGGGVALNLVPNPNNDADGDVVCIYVPDPHNYPTNRSNFDRQKTPNTVHVRTRRDSIQNGSLSLFFARILGINSGDLNREAAGTYQGDIVGFKIQWPGSTTVKLLPYALDVRVWDNDPSRPWYTSSMPPGIVQGNGQDLFTWTKDPNRPGWGTVTSGGDGIPEAKLFPLDSGSPGNFGTVDIGALNNSTSDIARQILYGPNVADMAYFPNGTLQLNMSLTPPSTTLQGDTGVSAGVKDELASIIGQGRIIPLYWNVPRPPGNGNNCTYTIVAFAGITITEVVLTGSLSNKHLTVQPCFVIDGNMIGGGSDSGTSTFIYLPLKLTR